jgi:hypothetical protein
LGRHLDMRVKFSVCRINDSMEKSVEWKENFD